MVDILRATSVMVTAMAHGVKSIRPGAQLEEARAYLGKENHICAAERGGDMVEGFAFGNSPLSYMNGEVEGKNMVMTTTNGTLAITKSKSADEVLVGAFLNITALADYISKQSKDVIIHCAGWKGKTNMEDTLFAGALVKKLLQTHHLGCDTPSMALTFYQAVKDKLYETVKDSSHAKRLNGLSIVKDIEFCMKMDKYDIVPKLQGDVLVNSIS